jgi:hypothetical protein
VHFRHRLGLHHIPTDSKDTRMIACLALPPCSLHYFGRNHDCC